MKKKILWITETAVMLALLVTLQSITKPMGQLVTGSCVNAILAVSVLVGGLTCGISVAMFSPVLAFLLGIAPQILTVPVIMIGNAVYVFLLHVLTGKAAHLSYRHLLAWVTAAAAKFFVLHILVIKVICGVLSDTLLTSGALKPPMLNVLPATFSWLQLFTALIGGALGLLIYPILRKALHK